MNHRLTPESLPDLTEPTIPAVIKRVHIETGVSLQVAVADARSHIDDPTILFFLPWSEYVTRPDATDRYRLLATALSSRVVALNNLGMGPGSSRLPRAMRHDIERGDFGGHERMHLEALHQLAIPLGNVSLMGYSLGTSLAAGFARELNGYGTVDSLTIGEPVGITQQHTLPLMAKFAREMTFWARDRRLSHKIHPEWMPSPTLYGATIQHFARHTGDYMAYPRGLATAPILADLEVAYGQTIDPSVPIRIINGGGSVISPTVDNEQFVDKLAAIGYTNITHDVYDGEVHGAIDVPRKIVAMFAATYPESS